MVNLIFINVQYLKIRNYVKSFHVQFYWHWGNTDIPKNSNIFFEFYGDTHVAFIKIDMDDQ